jgi:hypothetical protein
MKKNNDEKFIRKTLEKLEVSEDKIIEKIRIGKKLKKNEEKRLSSYREKIKSKKEKDFAIFQEEFKRKVNEKNQYVPLKDYIIKIQKISLRKSNPKRQKYLDLVKTLKNTIFFPTIATRNAEVLCEKLLDELKDWDYWAIELDTNKMSSGYLSVWFNENIPKQQIMGAGSGNYMPHLTKKDLEKLHVMNHSLSQQKQILKNISTSISLMIKANEIRDANVFEPTHISIDDITNNIPDLELDMLLKKEESVRHELKSSLRYSVKKKINEDFLIEPILKTIVAFLNTEGGHLLVGIQEVHDGDNIILGIEIDGFISQDEWHRHLKSVIKTRIDIKYLEKNIKVEFKKVNNKTIAIIKVAALDKKEHALLDEKKIFERKGPSNEELQIKNIGKWIMERLEEINVNF